MSPTSCFMWSVALFTIIVVTNAQPGASAGFSKDSSEGLPGPVLITEIKSLTLKDGGLTTARRGAPYPQLTCKGPACAEHKPQVVRCTNEGTDGRSVQWTCKADMAETLKFGELEVSCEGYSRPGDNYVLSGSCALTYELLGSVPKKPAPEHVHIPQQTAAAAPPQTNVHYNEPVRGPHGVHGPQGVRGPTTVQHHQDRTYSEAEVIFGSIIGAVVVAICILGILKIIFEQQPTQPTTTRVFHSAPPPVTTTSTPVVVSAAGGTPGGPPILVAAAAPAAPAPTVVVVEASSRGCEHGGYSSSWWGPASRPSNYVEGFVDAQLWHMMTDSRRGRDHSSPTVIQEHHHHHNHNSSSPPSPPRRSGGGGSSSDSQPKIVTKEGYATTTSR